MKKVYFVILSIAFGLLAADKINAQSIYDIRINEVMLFNHTNYIDSYGERSAWIELMNTGYNSVNVAGCYFTNSPNHPTMYRIPSSDPITKIPQQQFLAFFASGKNQHGTLHLNFTIDSVNRFIALFAPDGKTLLDSLTIPQLDPDKSFARLPNGKGNWKITEFSTPNSSNELLIPNVNRGDRIGKIDPLSIVMSITAMGVVFTALLVLYRLFKFTARFIQNPIRLKRSKNLPLLEGQKEPKEISGEVFAAISAALYLYETDKHDQESTILTIERVSRRYSPWSSKIYTLRQVPQRIAVNRK